MQMLFGILVSRHKPFVFSVSSSWGPLKCQPNGHVILQSSNLHIDSSAIYGGVQLYLHAFGNVAHRPYACVDGHIRILCASAVRLLFISRFFLPIWPVSSIGRSDWIGLTNSTNLKRGGKRRTEEKRSRWKEQSRTQRYFYRPTIENMRNHHPPESEGINRNMMNRGEGKRWRWIPRRGREHQIKQRRHRRHRRHHFPFDFFPHSRPLFYWRF